MAIPHDASLEFLPRWQPDETLFSLAARYHCLSGHVAGRHTSKILFGSPRAGYQHDLPSGIDHFVRVTNSFYGQSSQIIRNRTLLPYYLAFKDRRVARDSLASMRSQRIGHLKYRLGILTSGARAHHPLRACSKCAEEDRSKIGVGYWHLNHQFPGILVCPIHNQPLHVSTLKSSGVQRFGYFLPDDTNACLEELSLSTSDHTLSLLRLFAEISVQTSRVGKTGRLKLDAFRMVCDMAFRDRGYLSENGRIRQRVAGADFAEFVSPIARLAEFEALPREPRTISYMLTRLRSPSAASPHPMRLIAIIAWLFGSFEQYAAMTRELTAPKRLATHVDSTSQVRSLADKRRREFLRLVRSGDAISRAAARVGVDPAVGIGWARSERVPVVRRRKHVQGELLKQLERRLILGQTKQQIAKEVGVSVSSVSRVLYSDPVLAETWKERLRILERDKKRDTWQCLISSHGHLGTKILRAMEPAVYAWLYRNDRSWLQTTREGVATVAPQQALRVDWLERDNELVTALRRAINEITSSKADEPMTIGRLCQLVPDLKRRLGQTARLPRTRQLLNQVLNRGGSSNSSRSLPLN